MTLISSPHHYRFPHKSTSVLIIFTIQLILPRQGPLTFRPNTFSCKQIILSLQQYIRFHSDYLN